MLAALTHHLIMLTQPRPTYASTIIAFMMEIARTTAAVIQSMGVFIQAPVQVLPTAQLTRAMEATGITVVTMPRARLIAAAPVTRATPREAPAATTTTTGKATTTTTTKTSQISPGSGGSFRS